MKVKQFTSINVLLFFVVSIRLSPTLTLSSPLYPICLFVSPVSMSVCLQVPVFHDKDIIYKYIDAISHKSSHQSMKSRSIYTKHKTEWQWIFAFHHFCFNLSQKRQQQNERVRKREAERKKTTKNRAYLYRMEQLSFLQFNSSSLHIYYTIYRFTFYFGELINLALLPCVCVCVP